MKKNIFRIVLTILVILALLALGIFMVTGVLHILQSAGIDTGSTDPMFPEATQSVTRPPELDAEEVQPDHPTLDDYIDEELTPVDRTAEELAKEAAAAHS